ncbi:MAG: cobalamin-binding protein [Deltaproteobacteria bacterium]|nr:cobalamin-binding protein [Deltaproteobacteria bacterium]
MHLNKIILIFIFVIFILLPVNSKSEARIITDQLGREITVPDNPQRIISLAPNITEIIFALGQEQRLKGVTTYSDYPEQAKAYPKVGSYVHLDLEKIVSLKPDLCIAIKDGNPRSVITRLEKLNIPVYAVDPRNLEAIIETVLEIGILLNTEQRSKTLTKDMRLRIKRVAERIKKTDHKPKVFFQIGISPLVSVGTNTFIHELIILAGGQNLAQGKTAYPRFGKEQILSLLPEVFIISSMTNTESIDHLKDQWSKYPQIPAIKNNRMYHVDSNIFDRPTPRLVDALELLAKLIHPEVYENKSPKVNQ